VILSFRLVGGFAGQIFVEGNLEGEELASVGALDATQLKVRAGKRVLQVLEIVEEEAGTSGVRLHGEGAVFEL